ncbi:MAG: restriction endonuclease subunit S [Opitutaceae bacterium]
MASRYKAYPEYQDSGVELLGEVPRHWDVFQLKRSVDGCVNGIWGTEPKGGDKDTIVLRVADFDRATLSLNSEGYTYRRIDKYEKARRALKQGDLLLEKSGGGERTLVGQVVLFDKPFEAVTSNFVAKMTPLDGFESRFLNYTFSRFYDDRINYCSIKQNTGIQNLDSNAYLSEKFCFPPLPEQKQIAHFLDHETAKIDLLIAKQQALIALLKEKRQAVISHAVTKGLNPNAKMKDSGVEWLGQVPEHWEVKPLKYSVSAPIIDGPHVSPVRRDSGIPFISAEAIGSGIIDFDKKWGYISEADHALYSKRYSPKPGDILVVKLGATTGVSAIVETDDDFNVWVPLATVRVVDGLNPYLIFFALQSHQLRDAIELNWTYGTQQTLGLGTLANLNFPIPPIAEVEEIVEYLKNKMPRYDDIISEAQVQIELLQERRTALISAAVTGKIDVRDFAPEAQEV